MRVGYTMAKMISAGTVDATREPRATPREVADAVLRGVKADYLSKHSILTEAEQVNPLLAGAMIRVTDRCGSVHVFEVVNGAPGADLELRGTS